MTNIEAAREHIPERKKASKLAMALEARGLGELAISLATSKLGSHPASTADHPAMLFHGFAASKESMKFVHYRLRKQGYRTYSSSDGKFYGATPADVVKGVDRLKYISDKHQQQVSLIGQSAGGILARYIAYLEPLLVHDVTTLGSAFNKYTHEGIVSYRGPTLITRDSREPLPHLKVPALSIYSTDDAIAGYSACLYDGTSPLEQNVRIRSSHIGMAFNHLAIIPILTQVPKPADETRTPFEANFPGAHMLYPQPHKWKPQFYQEAA
jgi:hypothetical protein